MTTTDARRTVTGSEVVTPRAQTVARRILIWVIVAVLVILLGVLALLTAGATTSTETLSATNPKPAGAEALIDVLKTDHVTVYAPRTLVTATTDALNAAPSTTVAVYDPDSILSNSQLRSLRILAPNLVLIRPSAHELAILAPGVSEAGSVPPTAKADCGYLPARQAGTANGIQQGYYVTAAAKVAGCFPFGEAFSLVRVRHDGQTVTVLGSDRILTNGSILLDGNAALALGVFGSTPHLVWYRPSLADKTVTTPDGVIPNPPWVGLAIALCGIILVAAAAWRGRRLGPVVVERMPVTVRSSETMEGRARLYQRASARSHAIDALRVGTISRIATACGLPRLASVDDVIAAASAVTGRDSSDIRAILLDETPSSDLQLVHLSDRLLQLEDQVRLGVVPA